MLSPSFPFVTTVQIKTNFLVFISGVNATYTTLSAAVQKQPFATTASRCRDTVDFWKPCVCHIDMCIGWYPCGLKYCRGRDSAGNNVNYRCGIKTCKKCRGFDYYITQKSLCRIMGTIDQRYILQIECAHLIIFETKMKKKEIFKL